MYSVNCKCIVVFKINSSFGITLTKKQSSMCQEIYKLKRNYSVLHIDQKSEWSVQVEVGIPIETNSGSKTDQFSFQILKYF